MELAVSLFTRRNAASELVRSARGVCRPWLARLAFAALGFMSLGTSLHAAELTLSDGVVVKFGADSQLIVRDKLSTGKGAILTSQKDDTAAGRTGTAPQTPTPGDWKGVRIERSATLNASDVSIRYAGAQGNAALHLRGFSPAASPTTLRYFQITDSTIGLRLVDGASPRLEGNSFVRNGTALDADGNSSPLITGSQFVQSGTQAILNRTPATIIQAIGNWWGHTSGPRDPVGNAQGQGDSVSSGVSYGSWLTSSQLINPSVRVALPGSFTESNTVTVLLGCINAVEYRLSESSTFSGDFKPMVPQTSFVLSPGDGVKQLYVQYRDASGNQVVANLAGGVRLDAQGPTLAFASPAPGSVVNHTITVEATVSDPAGIARVELHIDDTPQGARNAAPWSFSWNTTTWAEGEHTLKLIAYDTAGHATTRTQAVTISRAPPPPDTDGPVLSLVRWKGAALTNGVTFAANGTLAVDASDRSGVSRIEFLIDGQLAGSISSPSSGSTYSGTLNLDSVANGPHTLTIRGVDSLNNASVLDFSVTVAHAVPNAPAITQPASALTTRNTSLTVSGTAQAGKQVQVLINGAAAGAPATAGNDGRFTTTVTLANGANQITAVASDAWGSSPPSAPVVVTVDTSVPQAPGNLAAAAQDAGKIRLSWARASDPGITGYHVYRSLTAFETIGEATRVAQLAASESSFVDLPGADGTYTYRVVSVNAVGTPSAVSNAAQAVSDNTMPHAVSIVYTPTGKVDQATGRIGQGRVDLVVTVNEALLGTPFLSVVPQGGAPIAIDLTRQDDTHYRGSFAIGPDTPSGTAAAVFSARDVVGNRGTEVKAGGTLKIDTQGPIVTGIAIAPTAPIKAGNATVVTATFTLSKAVKGGTTPEIKYLLSGAARAEVPIAGIASAGPNLWQASFTLPSDAGLGQPENLVFSFRALDDLDNVSTRITATNRFQVYQGELPPLGVPLNLKAEARPGGKVRLTWGAVDGASAYQIFRQAPGEAALAAWQRASGAEFIDTTTVDGQYVYAVASIRQSNDQESLSGQSSPVQVTASATAPGAPQNLTLELTGQGIRATWQPPLASTPASYNLYRSSAASINSTAGLTPIKTGIKGVITIDPSPSPSEHAYAVTALDAAGNESALSNSAYLNFSLLPVRTLQVEQHGDQQPVLSWTPGGNGAAGYNVFVAVGASQVKLNSALLTGTSFTDGGYSGGERRYNVVAVDNNQIEMARDITLPNLGFQVVGGLPIKRGIMNKVQVQVANLSASAVTGLSVTVKVGGTTHRSTPLSLNANETKVVPVIVGGYDTLPNPAAMTTGVEIVPAEGELVRITRNTNAEVADGSLVVGISPESFTRGGVGKVRLAIENTTETEVELLTARNSSADPSDELRFKLLDTDGNVIATQPYKQAFGASVITIASGHTVARIPAGASYTSDAFSVNVPAAAPNTLRVRLDVDKIHYRLGQPEHVAIKGSGSEKTVSLADTAYAGEITSVAPQNSFGDTDIVITGRAVDRATGATLANAALKLFFNQQGFERTFDIQTDLSGAFTYTFKPTATDAGFYQIAALHPAITDRPVQSQFTINRVGVSPTLFKLTQQRNYPYTIDFRAIAGAGTSATGLRLVYEAQYQPTGTLPEGIVIQLPAPINIAARQNLSLPVIFAADNTAQPTGAIVLKLYSNESGANPLATLRVEYTLVAQAEAKPTLSVNPSFIETGMAQGGTDISTLLIENKGLAAMNDVTVNLATPSGGTAPGWVSLAIDGNLGSLGVGQKRNVDINFAPTAAVSEGVHEFRLNIQGGNIPPASVRVFASVTQSGIGSVLFKASDMYTATLDKQGRLIPGLAGARIVLQNEAVASQTYELVTDSLGEAWFRDIPAGRYKYRATASNHQEIGGRIQIKPGITLNEGIFLDTKLITVEWSVREVTIQDRYEITLNATYETDVPAAVVVLAPASINLPLMKAGEVYYGELTLTNFGLVRADNVRQIKPRADAFFRFEFLADIPPTLEAKQRLTIPYRVIALQSLDQPSGTASGGGCYSYSNSTQVPCTYTCANGTVSSACGSQAHWYSASNSTCPAGTGGIGGGVGGGGGGIGGGGGGGFGGIGGAPTYTDLPGMPACVNCEGSETRPPCATCGAN